MAQIAFRTSAGMASWIKRLLQIVKVFDLDSDVIRIRLLVYFLNFHYSLILANFKMKMSKQSYFNYKIKQISEQTPYHLCVG